MVYDETARRTQNILDLHDTAKPKPIPSRLTPDQQCLANRYAVQLKAITEGARLLWTTLNGVGLDLTFNGVSISTIREEIEKCWPIVNSLSDRIDRLQLDLREDAERDCRLERH